MWEFSNGKAAVDGPDSSPLLPNVSQLLLCGPCGSGRK